MALSILSAGLAQTLSQYLTRTLHVDAAKQVNVAEL